MNKLSRERVKNNFKWIYVQPTSSRLKIDGLGTVINCILFSSPTQYQGKQAVKEPGRERHSILLWWTPQCLCMVSPPVWQARPPGLNVALGQRAWIRGCQEMCVCRFCSTFPGSLLSVLQRPNVCAMKIDAGDALFSPATQAHSLEHGGSSSQLIF